MEVLIRCDVRFKVAFFILLKVCVYNITVEAQDKYLADSLKKVLVNCKNDSAKYRMLLTIAKNDLPLNGLLYANKALQIAVRNKDSEEKALAYEHISICQRRLRNNNEAMEASLKALRIYDSLGMGNLTAKLQLQIGSHFTNDGNYQQGIYYIKQALANLREHKKKLNVMYALINLGETYRLMGVLDSAAIYFNESLALNKEQNNNRVQAYALGNLGMVHAQINELEQAKQELKESIILLKPMGDAYSVSVYQAELAKIYIKQDVFTEGEKLLLESLELAQDERLKEQIRDINNDLASIYEQKGMYKKALAFRKQYEIYQDSLVNIENVRKIEQLHSKYWLDKKETSIQFLEKENTNKRRQVLLLAVGVFLLIVLSVFLQYLNRQRKKAYRKVSEQNEIIEKREQEKAMLLKELNHRVKNNLQMVASLINLQAQQCTDENTSKALSATRNRIDTLILIHQKLYSENEDMQADLKNYISELVNNLIYGTTAKVKLALNLTSIYVHIDTLILLGLIINELVTNSLKYASEPDKDLEIDVSLIRTESHVYLTISDNGNGVHEGYEKEKAGSMGMKLVHSLIKQLKAELKYELKAGSVWTIILDKNNMK